MAHFNFFGIDNFRVFNDLNRFDLKPITILVGTNSSGKSSLSKGMLALKPSFEKIKYRQNFHQKKDKEYIYTGEMEKLFFLSDLNVGNFSTCLNNKSNRADITFEFPMKLGMKILEDTFIIRFVYEKDNNALQNGSLKDIFIFHLDTNIETLHYNNSDGLKVNFSFLKNRLDEAWKKTNEKFKNSNRSLDYETKYFLETYSPNLPLFKFPYPFSEEFLKNIQENSNMSTEEMVSLLCASQDILDKFQTEKTDVNSYIERSLLDCLDNYLLKVNDPFGFTFTISDLLYNYLLPFNSLCSSILNIFLIKEPVIKRVVDHFELYDESLVGFDDLDEKFFTYLKENKPLISVQSIFNTGNFNFIINCIYNSIGYSLNSFGLSYKNTHFIPAVRTKMDRFFRIGSGESYLQEILYTLHQTNLTKRGKLFVDNYLQKFGIADNIELTLAEDSSGTKIYLTKDDKRFELADVGYGVAQVLPIILTIGYLISSNMPEYYEQHDGWNESTIIIEEPETNLHPALQSKLADMFVECYQKYNIQFIVETHSEYLIRKLQYLTAKKEFTANDLVIYYFNDPDNIPTGEKQVKKIEILEDGSLSDDFGSGFFDEATNWKFELMQLRKVQRN